MSRCSRRGGRGRDRWTCCRDRRNNGSGATQGARGGGGGVWGVGDGSKKKKKYNYERVFTTCRVKARSGGAAIQLGSSHLFKLLDLSLLKHGEHVGVGSLCAPLLGFLGGLLRWGKKKTKNNADRHLVVIKPDVNKCKFYERIVGKLR